MNLFRHLLPASLLAWTALAPARAVPVTFDWFEYTGHDDLAPAPLAVVSIHVRHP